MIGLVIYGWRTLESQAEYGQFHCPVCQGQRQYTLIKLNRYFTLYFIPLIPLGTVAQAVECHSCRRQFEQDVLTYNPGVPSAEKIYATVAEQLTAGRPAEEIQGMMVQAGMSPQQSQELINLVLSGAARTCARCNLHFAKSARACSQCGDALLEAH